MGLSSGSRSAGSSRAVSFPAAGLEPRSWLGFSRDTGNVGNSLSESTVPLILPKGVDGAGWVKAAFSGFPIEVLFYIVHRMEIRKPCNSVSPLHTLPPHLQTLPNGGWGDMMLLGD